jgi:hypothetical protein
MSSGLKLENNSYQMFDQFMVCVLPLSAMFSRHFVVTNDLAARPVEVNGAIAKNVDDSL